MQQRTGHNGTNTLDTKGGPENHCTGNPRTIIVPPLKTQASEVLVECDSLGPGNLGPQQARTISLLFLFSAIRNASTSETKST